MAKLTWRTTALGMATSLALTLAGCEQPPSETAPPPTATTEAPPPAPDLAGGPAADAPMPPPPMDAQSPQFQGMAPIPNPEDMDPVDRDRIYGHRYDQPAPEPAWMTERPHRWLRRHPVYAAAWPYHHHHRVHGMIAANGALARASLRGPAQPHAVSAGKAAAIAGAGVAAYAAAAPKPTSLSAADRLSQLQSALAGPVAERATLAVADDLADGKPGPVTLSLPASAFDMLRDQAGKLDLAKAASRLDVRAVLSGDGYLITPATSQVTQPQPGQPVTFTWQVQPGQVQPQAGAGGMLKVEVAAELRGAGALKTLPLLSLEKPVKAPVATAPPPREEGLFDRLNQGLGSIAIPGLGKVPGISLLAILLLVGVVAALVAAAHRQSAERERDRRRRSREAAAAAFDEQVRAVRSSSAYPAQPAPEPKRPETV